MSEFKDIDREKLADLLAKVKAATGPDRRLDGAIEEWLYVNGMNFYGHLNVVPEFTASIDAALALVERMLGRATMWSVCIMEEGPYAQVLRPMPDGGYVGGHAGAYGNSAPLAILAALLLALSQEPTP